MFIRFPISSIALVNQSIEWHRGKMLNFKLDNLNTCCWKDLCNKYLNLDDINIKMRSLSWPPCYEGIGKSFNKISVPHINAKNPLLLDNLFIGYFTQGTLEGMGCLNSTSYISYGHCTFMLLQNKQLLLCCIVGMFNLLISKLWLPGGVEVI